MLLLFLEPSDYDGPSIPCNPLDSLADSDGDCYLNYDEVLNGTDICNAADRPSDYDNDCISDLVDDDDDNDGILDELDPFALDSLNGSQNLIPYKLIFNNQYNDGIEGWEFTGIMTNNVDNYMIKVK